MQKKRQNRNYNLFDPSPPFPPEKSNGSFLTYMEQLYVLVVSTVNICSINLNPPYLLFFTFTCFLSDKIRTILDIGCGVDKLTANIAKYFPDAKVVGIDVDNYAIETAIKLKDDKHLTNVEFYHLGADN